MSKAKFAVAFIVAAMAAAPATADLLGAVKHEDCVLNQEGFDCIDRTAFTVSVGYGLQTTLDAVTVSAIQVDGEPVEVEETVEFEFEKSRPTVTYPLFYDHTIAYHPRDTSSMLMFDGYRIGEAVIDYTVAAKVSRDGEILAFELSPQDPFFSLDLPGGFGLKARLVGDVARYRGIPELDNFFLYIPASPPEHPYVADFQHNMLLVPREEVSYEGTECDKAGYVPPEQNEKTRPWARDHDHDRYSKKRRRQRHDRDFDDDDGIFGKKRPQRVVCLDNQLFDKHNADLMRLISDPDAETTYLVQGIRALGEATLTRASGLKLLVHEPPEINNTLVTMTMKVDTLKEKNTESLGIIVGDPQVRAFKSHSRGGTLEVEIQNYGDLKTDYVVTVTACNDNIVPAIPAQSRVLQPTETATLKFPILTTGAIASGVNHCHVTLKSPTGRQYDEKTVEFDTLENPEPTPP